MIESASRPGREHQRLERNNQDALALLSRRDVLVLVAADGCSQARHSEVGAWLGARWLAHLALDDADPQRLHEGLVSRLRGLDLDTEELAESLLFSWTLARIDRRKVEVVGCGDGIWSLGGPLERRDPGPDNAPPYTAYGLVEGLDAPLPERLAALPTEELRLLVVASDGLQDLPPGALADTLEAPAGNPHRLDRLLRRHALELPDDTSLFLLRRRPCG